MSIRNEIKAQIVRAGFTMQELVDRLAEEYDWSDSVSNLSAKLQRESIRYKEVMELADVLGYDIVWQKRRDNRRKHSMPFFALPSTRDRRSVTLSPTTSALRRSTPAIPILTPHAATLTSIWYPRNANTVRRPKSRLLKQAAAHAPTACGWWKPW